MLGLRKRTSNSFTYETPVSFTMPLSLIAYETLRQRFNATKKHADQENVGRLSFKVVEISSLLTFVRRCCKDYEPASVCVLTDCYT